MKKIIFLLFIALQGSNVMAQFSVYVKGGEPLCNEEQGKKGEINFYNGTPSDAPSTLITDKVIKGSEVFKETCKDVAAYEVLLKPKTGEPLKVTYQVICKDKTIMISSGGKNLDTLKFENGEFKKASKKTIKEPAVKSENERPKDLAVFPLKDFTPVNFKTKKCNRILVIDAKADKYNLGDETGLYRYSTSDEGETTLSLKPAEALPINRYLAVVIKNYNFHDLERFSIEVNGENYTYEQDIRKIYDLVVGSDPLSDGTIEKVVEGDEDKSDPALLEYLKEANRILATYTEKSLNLNDLYKLEEFKLSLINYYDKNKDTKFGYKAKLEMQKIISWHPSSVSLTPISIDVPENDQVEIEYTMKNRNSEATKKSLGNFKTFGGVSVGYGAAFYLTDLRNNEVYTKSTGADAAKDTRAVLAQTNEESIGFGLNIDVSYRTGLHFRPTFNFGFFVPLEEEVTPFIATGPGIGFYSKNYKINLSWGLSLGKVNAIKEQYQDVNLEGLELTNTDLTEKVLKSGHYCSLSISFNL